MILKYLLLVFFLTGAFWPVAGQDRVYQQMIEAKNDTVKVQNLITYGRRFMDTDAKTAINAFENAIQISQKLQYDKGAGQSWISIGYIKAQSGAYREAIECYHKAIRHWNKLGSAGQVTRCLNTIGTIYDFLGRRDSAIIVYMQSAKLLENSEDLAALGSTYSYIGVLHTNAGNYEKAVLYLRKSVDLLTKTTDTAFLIEALTELSDTYVAIKEPQNAIPLAREALRLALSINSSNTDKNVLATAYYSIALTHLALNQLDSATMEAKRCIDYAKSNSDINTYGGGALVLSDCYKQSGNDRERYRVLKEALTFCQKAGNVLLLQYTYDRLADAANRLGKYQEAFTYHKEFVLYKDSLFNQKNHSVLSELEVKYQTAQKEKMLSQQKLGIAEKEVQLQKSKQMSLYSIGSAVVALMVALLMFFHFRSKRTLDQKQLQTMRQEKEIHLLQAVMQGEEKERSRIAKDLHDGVAGMLAAVKMHFSSVAIHFAGVLQTEGYLQGLKLLDEASQEVRKTSHNLMPEVLLQHGLDEAVRRYCNNVTNSSKLLVQYDSIGAIGRFVDSFELSVYRIVQELLNNIVKHSRASEAIVQITYQQQLLSISIEDNGIGLSNDGPQKDGIGLKSLQSRVKAMNGRIEFDSAAGQGLNAYLEFETAGLEKTVAQPVA